MINMSNYGNMTLPNAHDSSVTKIKNNEMYEMPDKQLTQGI
jgi:hypothetical protein